MPIITYSIKEIRIILAVENNYNEKIEKNEMRWTGHVLNTISLHPSLSVRVDFPIVTPINKSVTYNSQGSHS